METIYDGYKPAGSYSLYWGGSRLPWWFIYCAWGSRRILFREANDTGAMNERVVVPAVAGTTNSYYCEPHAVGLTIRRDFY